MGSCRCKMCGAHIHYDDNLSVATCEYCGTEQTVFRADSEKQIQLFNRANALRMQNEFDKAQLTYDNILIDDPNNAEAHWGICLCRYGIEYVDSPTTGKKIPTCHRTAIKSIFDDLDYKEAIGNADVIAKKYYEGESKVIDRLQKDIIKVSQKEPPYDIFISYKEHDESGNRTTDSIYAEKLYYDLKDKGYRLFFSKVTLKGKTPAEYEPIIFSALISSKVMISIGSKKEYFESVWEKNEWSRFLSFMQENHNKYLIPCYFDMESYDMPDEFLAFDGVNLKLDFEDDLYKRIDGLFNRKREEPTPIKNVYTEPKPFSLDNRLERICAVILDGDFKKANELIEEVLNIDYKCAKAYYYKVFVNLRMKDTVDLVHRRVYLDSDANYYKAVEYADKGYKEYLINLNKSIKEQIKNKITEEKCSDFFLSIARGEYARAIELAKMLKGIKDVDERAKDLTEECYKFAVDAKSRKFYTKARDLFHQIPSYKDSVKEYLECCKLANEAAVLKKAEDCCVAMDNIIISADNKTITDRDKDIYADCLSYVRNYGGREINGKNVSYYISKQKYVNKVKTANDIKYAKEQRKRTILILLGVFGAFAYMCFLIVPIIVFASKGNAKGAGGWVGIDMIVIIATIIIGYFIADRL